MHTEPRPLTGLPTLVIVAALLVITAAGTQLPGWAQLGLAFGLGLLALPTAVGLPLMMFWLARETPARRTAFFDERRRRHTIHGFALIAAVTLVLAFLRGAA